MDYPLWEALDAFLEISWERASVIKRVVNILIAFSDTISLSADILIASAEALIVATDRNGEAEDMNIPLLPICYFFVVTLSHFEHNQLRMYTL
ncbi:hypothetical protein FHS60_001165 [Alloprevotella rava]|uniref:Uncharacterized protein n=1 Tax=Alloprevotella rava TaxID=671218 RepID=A0A7W5UMF7_9BACT|nr:hypothetical protein [Alloprevotella rava]